MALDLLGRDLNLRATPQAPPHLRARIVEVEVYGGREDAASHANGGVPTTRTQAMFAVPGTCYVYLIYGAYYCLNVAARAETHASAILIRALEPLDGLDTMRVYRGMGTGVSEAVAWKRACSGPGKLCQAFGITKQLNHTLMTQPDSLLYFTQGVPLLGDPARRLVSGPRIGLNPKTCGEAAQWCWRYGDGNSGCISKKF